MCVCNIDKQSEPGDKANWQGGGGGRIIRCVWLPQPIHDVCILEDLLTTFECPYFCDFFLFAGILYKAEAKKIKHTTKGQRIVSDKHDSRPVARL